MLGKIVSSLIIASFLLLGTASAQGIREEAEILFAEGERLRQDSTVESRRAALAKYEAALVIFHELGVKDREAASLNNIGFVKAGLGQSGPAMEALDNSLAISRQIGNGRLQAIALLNIGQVQRSLGRRTEATEALNEGLAVSRSYGEREMEAAILNGIGFSLFGEGEVRAARERFTEALTIFRGLGEARPIGSVLNNIGRIDRMIGEQEVAVKNYEQALEIFQTAKHKAGEADVLLNLSAAYADLFRIRDSIDYSSRALDMFREMGNAQREAVILNNIGALYLRLSDPASALGYYSRSAELAERIGDARQHAAALKNIGDLYMHQAGGFDQAVDFLGRALEISRAAKDPGLEGEILSSFGSIHSKKGEGEKALSYLNESLTILRRIPSKEGEMNALVFLADFEINRGNTSGALRSYEDALKISRELMMPQREANILVNISLTKRKIGDLNGAENDVIKAIEIIEKLRDQIPGDQFRSAFFTIGKTAYELYIDLLLGAGQGNTDPQKVAAAFDLSERSRARGLLDSLAESNVEIRKGVDLNLLEQERLIKIRLNNKENHRLGLVRNRAKPEHIEPVEKEIGDILQEFRQIQAKIRISSPEYSTIVQPTPATLEKVRSDLLDNDSILLEYSLGSERSYVWTVTRESAFVYMLPNRADIEKSTRRFLSALSARNEHHPNESGAARRKRLSESDRLLAAESDKLSTALLSPFLGELKGKRILIVADGVLQYLPFAALKVPAALANMRADDESEQQRVKKPAPTFKYLVETNEIAYLPSASTVLVMRSLQKRKNEPSENLVSIMADPVFTEDDVRLRSARTNRGTIQDIAVPSRSGNSTQLSRIRSEFGRLRFSRKEAEWISQLVTEKREFVALDFEANRNTATGAAFGDSRFIHFATHGIVNSEFPELSGIVLSLWDENGNEQDGFLRLHDIYNLELNTDLVVLSACETALGKEIKGEGIVGLTRGFMYAGAPSVVASYWRVDDRATADLMKRFYQRMIREGMPPSTALRGAQSSMLSEKTTSHPFYWAGFALQGEWRPIR
jgi:CHAT domain-containing protein